MKKSILMGALTTLITLSGFVPQAAAAAGDSITFNMARAAGATGLGVDKKYPVSLH